MLLNNKDFTSELSERIGVDVHEAAEQVETLIAEMTQQLEEGNVLVVEGFGTFEVKKKTERIVISPASGQRFLVPPQLVLTFKSDMPVQE